LKLKRAASTRPLSAQLTTSIVPVSGVGTRTAVRTIPAGDDPDGIVFVSD